MKVLSPVIAATAGVPWKLFLVINSAATVFYVAVYMLIGILFHSQLNTVFRKLQAWQHIIFIVLMVAAGIFIFIKIRRSVTKKA